MLVSANNYTILLYYCYSNIENEFEFKKCHINFCKSLNLKGRIIISKEGINGTIAGNHNDCFQYINSIKNDNRFVDIDFKIQKYHLIPFKSLKVKLKEEIVNSGIINNYINYKNLKIIKKAQYIYANDVNKIIDKKNIIFLDVRSQYEYNLGRFKNAISLNINYFRDFASKVDNINQYKNNTIITYCTGGVRCEKASSFLIYKGFKNVYQLYGGIIKYGMQTNGCNFDGKCYVFDQRISISINQYNHNIISRCFSCKTLTDTMINCYNVTCNKHIVQCYSCNNKMNGCCSINCYKKIKCFLSH